MKRFLEIISDGEFILASENESIDNYKSAAFYLNEVTKGLSDLDFENWLLERMDTGFNQSDIEQLQEQYKNPVLKHFLAIMNFPIYCSSMINSCILLNGLQDK